jgi:hypothetical protein
MSPHSKLLAVLSIIQERSIIKMEPSNLLEWAFYLGATFFVFSVITGFDEVITKYANGSPTKKDLSLKVDELEKRIKELESVGN